MLYAYLSLLVLEGAVEQQHPRVLDLSPHLGVCHVLVEHHAIHHLSTRKTHPRRQTGSQTKQIYLVGGTANHKSAKGNPYKQQHRTRTLIGQKTKLQNGRSLLTVPVCIVEPSLEGNKGSTCLPKKCLQELQERWYLHTYIHMRQTEKSVNMVHFS